MKFPTATLIAFCCAASGLMAASPETPPPAIIPPAGPDPAALATDLGDERFRIRENATRELWKLGEAALPALRDAASSGNPEQAYRARQLLHKIQLHITPDTDPSVSSLVERYLKASPSEKSALFEKMRTKRAWHQMLKLFADEKHPGLRQKLAPAMNGVALSAARERLLNNDAQGARQFLEMAPSSPESLLALADFHRAHGSLATEIERAKTQPGPNAQAWNLALQRAAGNLPAAIAAARAAGESRIAAALSALDGDPLPWLRETRGSTQENDETTTSAYTSIATKRWLGQKITPDDLKPLTHSLSARNSATRGAAINALFLLNQAALAEPAFAKAEPLAAFHHFLALERIPDALAALGLDSQTPDYAHWVAEKFSKLADTDIEDQQEPVTHTEELAAIANFLESRGLHDEAKRAFAKPLETLATKDEDEFLTFLGSLFNNSENQSAAPLLGLSITTSWAALNDQRWDDILNATFGEDQSVRDWWDWLPTLDPDATTARRFAAMLALHGIGRDPEKLRKHWLSLAWNAVENAAADKRPALANRIFSLCILTGDAAQSQRAWELLSVSDRKAVFWGQRIVQLSALDRWGDAANLILDRIADAKETKQDAGAELHAYAAASLRRAGRPDEAAAHDTLADRFALGSPPVAIRIGNAYAYGGDYTRAAEWWARAARHADPESGEFVLALKLHADSLLELGEWKPCAASSEVLTRIYASSDLRWTNPLPLMRQRLQADTTRALANLKTRRAASIATLEACHRAFASDGSLADFFFPALRKAGLTKQHDLWFTKTWNLMQDIIRRYPDADNTRNTAAWFAARALRQLDAAEKHLQTALASHPDQPAYLDTMAEIHFARGQREQALEWSRRAINFAPDDSQLRRQQERFRSAPLP